MTRRRASQSSGKMMVAMFRMQRPRCSSRSRLHSQRRVHSQWSIRCHLLHLVRILGPIVQDLSNVSQFMRHLILGHLWLVLTLWKVSSIHGNDLFHQQGMQPINHQSSHSQPIHTPSAPDFYSTTQPPLASPTLNITQTQSDLSIEHALPPYDLLYALVDLYFKHIK